MIQRPFEDRLDLAILGMAVLLSIAGLTTMVVLARTDRAIVGVAVYGATLVLTYTNAALYHWSQGRENASALLQALDHATIFLLIAGTYTPFCLLAFQDHGGWVLLASVWGIAVLGIGIRVGLVRRPYRWALLLYLAQGWIGIPWATSLAETAGNGALLFVAAGGVAYTAGIAFLLRRSFRFSNPVWHLFVLTGSACHFVAVAVYLLRYDAQRAGL